MSDDFAVVILPSPHCEAFAEVAEALCASLKDLGHFPVLYRHPLTAASHPQQRVIVFGCNAHPDIELPHDAIIYNMEQVGSLWFTDKLIALYEKYIVWDYSAENASHYAEIGLPHPAVVPFGYHKVLERFTPCAEEERDIDVLHVGTLSPRRLAVLGELEKRGLKVVRLFGVYGTERDAYYARAKIVLNIHFYELTIFEAARVNYCIANSIYVVSEESTGSEDSHLHSVAYDHLVGYVCEVLKQAELRSDAARMRLKDFRRMPMLPAAAAALKYLSKIKRAPLRRPKLVLSMIVKDEAKVIVRCLASVLPHIDAWCVVDTGSKDGTQILVENVLSSLPGQLIEEPWEREDKNRTQAFQHSAEFFGEVSDTYVLWIDADEELVVADGFDLRAALCADAHEVTVKFGTAFARPQILKADKKWRWVGRVHPYLEAHGAGPASPLRVEDVYTVPRAEGASWADPDKYKKHAELLEADCKEKPNDPRSRYYLAQSYRDAGQTRRAVANYLKRAGMPGWPEETWSAAYEAAKLMEGEKTISVSAVVNAYINAWRARPHRAETLHRLAKYLRLQCEYGNALVFAREAARLPMPADRLFVETDVYTWRALDELSLAAIYSGAVEEAQEAFRKLLLVAPASEKARLDKNAEHILTAAR